MRIGEGWRVRKNVLTTEITGASFVISVVSMFSASSARARHFFRHGASARVSPKKPNSPAAM
jgi:hypothetical protein